MTPKEKAQELVLKFEYAKKYSNSNNAMSKQLAKQCALIAVDEALNVFIQVHNALQDAGLLKFNVEEAATYKFWQEVKQEIEKL